MSNVTLSPNMGLPVPTVGVDSGPDWANNLNSSLGILDQHDHSSGSGVQITPAGLNINSDLPINNNNLTLLRSSRFSTQPNALSLPADLNCLYVTGVDLWYNDGSGNQIRLTSGGTVNATSSGIASGTATASFNAGVLVVNAASTTPANIQGASLLLGNNIPSSKFLTLSPPNSMGSNYSLVLPSVPGSLSFVTLDTSGNLATASSVYGTQIASQTLTGSQMVNNTVTRVQQSAVGQQISSSCGSFSTGAGTPTPITNLTVTITTTGRTVMVFCQADGSGNRGNFADANGTIYIFRGATELTRSFASGEVQIPPSLATVLDIPTAGTYTYTVQASSLSGTLTASNMVLVAYEL